MKMVSAKASKSGSSCNQSTYFKGYAPRSDKVHDLRIEGKGCTEIDIRPYYNVKKRPLETVLYPDFKFPDEPLPKPLAKVKLPSSSREGGVEYEAEYYNITPEQIDKMQKEKKIKNILMIHGAHHSVNLFLKHKDEASFAVYCHPLFSMKDEKEYIKRYTNMFKYPLIILTITSPDLPEMMASRGIPKAMGDLNPTRWCTREFKQEPAFRFKKHHHLENTVDLKGIHYHQSPDRERRKDTETKVRNDSYCFKDEIEKDEKGNPISIPAISKKTGKPILLKNGKPKMTFKKKKVLKEEGFIYQTLSPDYNDEEIDNYETMAENGIPLNPNTRLLDRHGCVFCPFAGKKYYEHIKEHRPEDYERCKKIIEWGSKNRIEKYNYLKKNLPRFAEKNGISKEDMKQIHDLFKRDRDWLDAETEFKNVILSKAEEPLSKRVKEIEKETGKEVTKAKREELLLDEIYNFPESEEGHKKLYDYLKQKFEKIEEYGDNGKYVLVEKGLI